MRTLRSLTALCTLLCITATGCSLDLNVLANPLNPRSKRTAKQTVRPRVVATPNSCHKLGKPCGPKQAELFNLVNAYRKKKGRVQLRYSRTLELAANRYAEQMYRENFFSHNAPDGTEPADRAVAAGYCDPIVGENIAYGMNRMDTPKETMQSFMDSKHHKENMLLKRWRYAGMGYHKVNTHKGSEYWWVQLFGMDVPANAILPKTKNKPPKKQGKRNRTRTRKR